MQTVSDTNVKQYMADTFDKNLKQIKQVGIGVDRSIFQ